MYLDQETVKELVSRRVKLLSVEPLKSRGVPLSALPKDTSELAGLFATLSLLC